MLLHLLYVNPNRSERELNRLRDLLKGNRNNIARTMLTFCYNELPIHYKSCLLYLSIFPQGHPIRRTSLLRRWIAEGLIAERSITGSEGSRGMSSLEDQAEHIFNSLVARGFIRPGESSTSGKIKSFTVHHAVREFIATDVSLVETSLPRDLAHRLSINSGIAVQKEAYSSSRPFGCTQTLLELMPQSPQWQLLKVLDLEGCTGFKKKHLKNICKILLLKYLSLRKTDVTELPKQIEKLQCLETLDIRQTAIKVFSKKSIRLPMLKYLLAGYKSPATNNSDRFEESFVTVGLPSGIRQMQKLEILSHFEVFDNVDKLNDIGQLLQLRKLGVILHREKGGLILLFQQIEKLHDCLRSLSVRINQPVRSESAPDAEAVPNLETPPKLLESLRISGVTSGLPLWVAKLDQLAKVTLRDTLLREDAINILGKLRMLRCLRLLHNSYTESEINFKDEEFQRLRFLIVEGSYITNISFGTGAAPKLEGIVWSFDRMDDLSGINHLQKLKRLELNGGCNNLDQIREVLEKHPNNPELKHNPLHQCEERTAATASSGGNMEGARDHQSDEDGTAAAASSGRSAEDTPHHQSQEDGPAAAASSRRNTEAAPHLQSKENGTAAAASSAGNAEDAPEHQNEEGGTAAADSSGGNAEGALHRQSEENGTASEASSIRNAEGNPHLESKEIGTPSEASSDGNAEGTPHLETDEIGTASLASSGGKTEGIPHLESEEIGTASEASSDGNAEGTQHLECEEIGTAPVASSGRNVEGAGNHQSQEDVTAAVASSGGNAKAVPHHQSQEDGTAAAP
ncbi:hypothetical protein EJB05_26172, partial [Eragrostis curvula]